MLRAGCARLCGKSVGNMWFDERNLALTFRIKLVEDQPPPVTFTSGKRQKKKRKKLVPERDEIYVQPDLTYEICRSGFNRSIMKKFFREENFVLK